MTMISPVIIWFYEPSHLPICSSRLPAPAAHGSIWTPSPCHLASSANPPSPDRRRHHHHCHHPPCPPHPPSFIAECCLCVCKRGLPSLLLASRFDHPVCLGCRAALWVDDDDDVHVTSSACHVLCAFNQRVERARLSREHAIRIASSPGAKLMVLY